MAPMEEAIVASNVLRTKKNGCMWKAASPLVLPTRPFQPAWLVPNLVVWTVLIRCPYASCIVQLETIVNARPRSDCRRQRKSWEHGPWSLCRLLPLNWYVAAPNSVIMHCEVEARSLPWHTSTTRKPRRKGRKSMRIRSTRPWVVNTCPYMSTVFRFGAAKGRRLVPASCFPTSVQGSSDAIVPNANNARQQPEDEAQLRARPDVAQGELVRVTDQFCFCS